MPNPLVKLTNPTEADIYKMVGDDVIARWVTLGETIDKAQYALGMEAKELIDHFDELPAYKMAVYKAIAKKAKKSTESIRKYYYTVRDVSPELFSEFENLSFGVFTHAARFDDKQRDVLQYAQKHDCGLDELYAVFPVVSDSSNDEVVKQGDFPAYYGRTIAEARLHGVWNQVEPLLLQVRDIIGKAKKT